MTKRAQDRPDGETATLLQGGGARPPVPVQTTNIVQIIAEHLPGEYEALTARISKQQTEMESLLAYKSQLQKIAADAGVDLNRPSTSEVQANGQ